MEANQRKEQIGGRRSSSMWQTISAETSGFSGTVFRLKFYLWARICHLMQCCLKFLYAVIVSYLITSMVIPCQSHWMPLYIFPMNFDVSNTTLATVQHTTRFWNLSDVTNFPIILTSEVLLKWVISDALYLLCFYRWMTMISRKNFTRNTAV